MICVVVLVIILLMILPIWVLSADVVDMEVHAIAKACKEGQVNFRCFKYVSDQADENASEEWTKTVADGEKYYMNVFQQIVGGG